MPWWKHYLGELRHSKAKAEFGPESPLVHSSLDESRLNKDDKLSYYCSEKIRYHKLKLQNALQFSC